MSLLGKRKSSEPSVQEQAEAKPRRVPIVVDASSTLARETQLQQLSRQALKEKSLARVAARAELRAKPGHRPSASSSADLPLEFDTSDRAAFQATFKQVEELGATMLVKKDKRAFQEKKLKELGVAPIKQNMPIKILKGMKEKNAKREAKQRELDIAAGNKVFKKKSDQPRVVAQDLPMHTSRHVGARIGKDGAMKVSRDLMREMASNKSMSLAKHFKRR